MKVQHARGADYGGGGFVALFIDCVSLFTLWPVVHAAHTIAADVQRLHGQADCTHERHTDV